MKLKKQLVFLCIGLCLACLNNVFSNAKYFKQTNVNQSINTLNPTFHLNNTLNDSKVKNNIKSQTKTSALAINKKSIEIKPEVFSYKYENPLTFSNGIVFGFLLMLLVLNLTCYLLFGDNLFLYLGAYITAFTSLFWLYDILHLTFLSQIDTYALTATLLLLFGGVSMVFSYHFLSFNKHFKSIKMFSLISMIIITSCIIIGYYFNSQALLTLANSITLAMLLTHFIAGSFFFNKKNYIKFFVLSSFIPLLFFVDYFALKPLHIYFLGVTSNHIEIAMVIQILILSYAIIYKMNEITEEVEIKKTEMKIFLKQQDSLSRSNVEKLVEDVYLENLIMHYDLDGIEIKLLQYISEGKSNEKIARKLKLTASEVKEYTQTLYEKLEIEQKVHEDQTLLDTQPDYIYN